MEYEIRGGSFPIVVCKLQKGETLKMKLVDNQEIGFSARSPGKIMAMKLNGSNTIIGQKNAFLAAENSVD